MMASRKDGPHPILTLVGKICPSPHLSRSEMLSIFLAEVDDNESAFKRRQRRMDARDRDEQLTYLKGLVTRAWNRVARVFPSVPSSSQVTSMESQRQALDSTSTIPEDHLRTGNVVSVSTCIAADKENTSRLVHRHQTVEIVD